MSAIEETYEDVKGIGYKLAYKYVNPGLTIPEAICLFDDVFLDAYHGGWDASRRASFSTWVTNKMRYRILDHRRRQLTELNRRVLSDDLDWVLDRYEEGEEDRPTIYDDISSGDARRILEHIAANRELYSELVVNQATAKVALRRIRAYLKNTFGWDVLRISAAVAVIRNHLKGRISDESTTN